MEKRTIIIIVSVLAAAVVATGLGVLVWWLLRDTKGDFTLIGRLYPDMNYIWPSTPNAVASVANYHRLYIELDSGDGIGTARYTAAFTRIRDVGDVFWWFYPTTATVAATKPILLWLDGVTGIPPSLLANFAMVGPYDYNLNARSDSWVDEFNLLFVDAPIGTGFSIPEDESKIPQNIDDHADHLLYTLNSFYTKHEEYITAPLYIIGQGSGAQIALQLAIRLQAIDFSHNLQGIVLANGIVSPALVITKLGFYLEEMGYIDYVGRAAIENYSNNLTSLVNQGLYPEAFDQFLTLGDYVNTAGETVAVNLGHIVEKLTRTTTRWSRALDYFGQKSYLQSISHQELFSFMDETVARALGIYHDTKYDDGRAEVVLASGDFFMVPTVDKVEYILQNTNLTVSIWNGNLDALSNTPGQLEWVNNLEWSGQEEFKNAPRQTLVVNRLVEGYFRVTDRLRFYWMNAAGQWVPQDSPAAAKRVIQLITET